MPTVAAKFRRVDPVDKEVIQHFSRLLHPRLHGCTRHDPKSATEDYGPRIEKGEVWVLEVEDEPTGIAVLEERADHLLVYGIAVKPDAQRRGYGIALLNFADQQAIGLGGCAKCGSTRTSGWKETCDFIADTALLRFRSDHIQVGPDRCSST